MVGIALVITGLLVVVLVVVVLVVVVAAVVVGGGNVVGTVVVSLRCTKNGGRVLFGGAGLGGCGGPPVTLFLLKNGCLVRETFGLKKGELLKRREEGVLRG